MKIKTASHAYHITESICVLDKTIELLEKYHLGVTKEAAEKLKALYNL
jgi:hypothetical protein